MLSEYNSLSRKSLSVWVTGCCMPPRHLAPWIQRMFVYMQMYGDSIATMERKNKIFSTLKGNTVVLLEWSMFLSYLLCILKKQLSQHSYLPTTTAPSSAQCLTLCVLFFCFFPVCSWTHQFSKLLNHGAMSYFSLKLLLMPFQFD